MLNLPWQKVIICGGTGNQGGAVAAAMLAEQRWNVIVLTRNPLSAASRRLEAAGAKGGYP